MITLPYCFLNTEIRSTIKQHWERWRLNRGSDPYIEGRNRSRFCVQAGHETTYASKGQKISKANYLSLISSKKGTKSFAFEIFLSLVEISIFSLNHAKVMNSLVKDLKSLIFKVIF